MEVEIIKAIQRVSNPFFNHFFEVITMFGEELIYIVIFAIAYWCWDKREATKLILVFLLSAIVNGGLKSIIMRERPIGYDGVITLREHTATGSSFPSGHTQGATTFFYYVANKFKKTWVTVSSWIMIFLVALSRLYLGLHWISDVIAAVIVAIAMVHFGLMLFAKVTTKKLISVLVIVNILLTVFWNEIYVLNTAIITGAVVGILIERKYINFDTRSKVVTQIIKTILGLSVALVIKEGTKLVVPDTLMFDYIRYILMGLWVSAGAPLVFKKLRLSD
ncbi:phosphatase PAP2 family protein [Mycoplasmatota bacterium WC44]